MCKQKSNTALNNIMFICNTINFMQKSVELLYLVAKKQRDVNTPSAVARVLGVSQQALKNWETRGISKEGALAAQRELGIDCNELLALNDQGGAAENVALVYPSGKTHPATPHLASENVVRMLVSWPFKTIDQQQWDSLDDSKKQVIETVISSYLNMGAAQSSQIWPANSQRTGT